MTEPPTARRTSRKYLKLSLALALAVCLILLGRGLIKAAAGSSPVAGVTTLQGSPLAEIQERPGTGSSTRYHACAVLSTAVLSAAGLVTAEGDIDEADPSFAGQSVCREVVASTRPNGIPMVALIVTGKPGKAAGTTTSHGIPYVRHPGSSPTDVGVTFGGAPGEVRLEVSEFPSLAGGEDALAKLIEGVAGNLAAGPKPPPGYRYPAPYDLDVKPCDAFPAEILTTITAHPADEFLGQLFNRRELPGYFMTSCSRSSTAGEAVTVTQSVYRLADVAAGQAQATCTRLPGWSPLPVPIGDASCIQHDDGDTRIVFHAGRSTIQVSYRDARPLSGDLVEGARRIFAALGE